MLSYVPLFRNLPGDVRQWKASLYLNLGAFQWSAQNHIWSSVKESQVSVATVAVAVIGVVVIRVVVAVAIISIIITVIGDRHC